MASDAARWRSLEPASLLVNLVPDLWRTAKNIWPLLLALLVGGPVEGIGNLVLIGLFFVLGAARTVVHFLTLRYRVHEGKLEIRSGLLARSHRVIDPGRIQNMEIVQNVFHKLAGLVELRVETAGEAGVEGLLSAIGVSEARALRAQLYRPGAKPDEVERAEVLHAVSMLELVGYGVSAGRVGAAVLMFGFAMEVLGPLSPVAVQNAVGELRPGAAGGLLLLALAGAYVVSVGGSILRYYGFRLLRGPDGIRLAGGLLTRRRIEIPVSKVQVVRVEEPWVRRAMGFGTIHIETAAVGLPEDASAAEGMIPMVATEELTDMARLVLPRLECDPWADPLLPAAPRALVRALLGATVRWSFLATIAAWFFESKLPFLVVPIGLALAALDWSRQGWRVLPATIVTRTGFLTRRTWILHRDKIQSLHLHQGPILRWQRLAQVEVWVAGTRITLPDLREADASRVYAELVAGATRSVRADEPVDGRHRREDSAQIRQDPRGDGVP